MIHKNEYPKQQHCPACNRYVKYSELFPNYACAKCTSKAVDSKSRNVNFVNNDLGDCQVILAATNKPAKSKVCFIKGLKFRPRVIEAGIILLLSEPSKRKTSKKAELG